MSNPSARRITLRTAWLAVFITMAMVPLVGSPYMHDDIPNRNWATASVPDTVSQAWALHQEWMTTQGRFFPGGFLFTIPVFHIFDSRAAYMTWLVVVNLALFALVAYLVYRLTRSPFITATSTLILGACMQARFGVLDGVQAFAGLVQFTLILTILSGLGAAYILRTGRRLMVIPVVLAWSWAITAYEVSLFMLPAVVLLLWAACGFRNRVRSAWALSALLIPAVTQFAISVYLRSGVTAGSGSYTTDLNGPVMTTFFKQFSAALPSSQYTIGTQSLRDMLPLTSLILVLVTLAIPVFVLWRPSLGSGTAVARRISLSLIAAGVWAWTIPAILAGITVRWQNELAWGQGYIYSIYQYAGVALLAGGALGLMGDRASSRGWKTTAIAVLAVACIGCTITVCSNVFFAGQFVVGPQGPG